MPRRSSSAATGVFLCLLVAATHAYAAGINLSWDDCGSAGSGLKTFACNSNSAGPFTLVASFVPPEDIDFYLGFVSVIDITASSATLPDWWQHGTGCRGNDAFSVSFDFAGFFACRDYTQGTGTGSCSYEVGYGGPDQARLRVQGSIPQNLSGNLDFSTEYYAYKVLLATSNTTGSEACAGCSVPVVLRLSSIQLLQHPEENNDPILTTALFRNAVEWQPAATSVPASPAVGLVLAVPRWDATAGGLAVSFSLPSSAPAVFEVFDLAGRRWTTRRLDQARTGLQRMTLAGPGTMASGVYFARLTQGRASVSRRFVIQR